MTDDTLGLDGLIHYIDDLENLVRWFAHLYEYEVWEMPPNAVPGMQAEKRWVTNDPIWTVWDERGNYLADSDRLKRTWDRVMHPPEEVTPNEQNQL